MIEFIKKDFECGTINNEEYCLAELFRESIYELEELEYLRNKDFEHAFKQELAKCASVDRTFIFIKNNKEYVGFIVYYYPDEMMYKDYAFIMHTFISKKFRYLSRKMYKEFYKDILKKGYIGYLKQKKLDENNILLTLKKIRK